jgi:hypothetical protein
MKAKYKPGLQVYFLICGRYITKATIVTSSPWFVTIRFSKRKDDCIIRLPYGRIFTTEEEARRHIHPEPPPFQSKRRNQNMRRVNMYVPDVGSYGNKKRPRPDFNNLTAVCLFVLQFIHDTYPHKLRFTIELLIA